MGKGVFSRSQDVCCACRVLLAPFFPSVAPGNLAKPSLYGLPSRVQAGQLPALLNTASGSALAKQVCVIDRTRRGKPIATVCNCPKLLACQRGMVILDMVSMHMVRSVRA